MTGYLSAGNNPLSKLTVRSLVDLGYTVKVENADSYTIPSGRRLRDKDDVDKRKARRRMYKDSLRDHKKKEYPIIRIFDGE
jgi:hypothetical protein